MLMEPLQFVLGEERKDKGSEETDCWCESKLPWSFSCAFGYIATDKFQVKGNSSCLTHKGYSGEDKVHAGDIEITTFEPEDNTSFVFIGLCWLLCLRSDLQDA